MIKIDNEITYTDIVEQYSGTIYRTAYQYLMCTADAEDAVQEVFIKLLKKRSCTFRDSEHLKAWLLRVTKNYCIDLIRRKKTQNETVLTEQLFAPESDEQHLLEELNQLKPKYREVLYLYYYEGYTIKEIAAITRTRQNTINSRLTRAREVLKKVLKEDVL